MMALMCDEYLPESAEPAPDGIVCSGQEAVSRRWREFFRKPPEARLDAEEIFGLGENGVFCDGDTPGQIQAGKKHMSGGVDVFRVSSGCIRRQLSCIKGKMG